MLHMFVKMYLVHCPSFESKTKYPKPFALLNGEAFIGLIKPFLLLSHADLSENSSLIFFRSLKECLFVLVCTLATLNILIVQRGPPM